METGKVWLFLIQTSYALSGLKIAFPRRRGLLKFTTVRASHVHRIDIFTIVMAAIHKHFQNKIKANKKTCGLMNDVGILRSSHIVFMSASVSSWTEFKL